MCDAVTLRGRGGVERATNPLHSARVYARSGLQLGCLLCAISGHSVMLNACPLYLQ